MISGLREILVSHSAPSIESLGTDSSTESSDFGYLFAFESGRDPFESILTGSGSEIGGVEKLLSFPIGA